MTTDQNPGNPTGSDATTDLESQLAMLQHRYGDRLSASEWDGVRKALATQREHAAKLRAVPLLNGDEPATIFQVAPGEADRD